MEASLLTGPEDSAIVLVNHTYKPIGKLRIVIRGSHQFATATSTEGVGVKVERTAAGTQLELPLEWTDVVLLPKP